MEKYIHHTEYFYFHIASRYGLSNVTQLVEQAIRRSGVDDGFCFISAMHITAGIFINDAEGGLLNDIAQWINDLAPFGKDYDHHRTGEDNADAHLKRQVMGREVVVAITNGRLDFGPWEQIFYGEFDGRRSKRVLVKLIGE
jgi:secondary thiamine-phosphate synthase enzyme